MPWYKAWFNSPYYHLLYNNRNEAEAKAFISKLVDEIKPQKDDHILDLACGKGRHAVYLNSLGFKVTGVDLSENSIEYAALESNETLKFLVGDMRKVLEKDGFTHVFSLFTSFGYFDDAGNQEVLLSIYEDLKPGGTLVLDFLNPDLVVKNLIPSEQIEKQGVVFHIQRKIENGKVLKTIEIHDGSQKEVYNESVRLITYETFINWFKTSGFTFKKCWGNYQLEAFEPDRSPRMIFLLSK